MNGNETGRAAQNAREMTAEIDRITEAEVEKLEQKAQSNLNREQAGNLGNQILTYNPEQTSSAQQTPEQANFAQQSLGQAGSAQQNPEQNNYARQNFESLDPIQREAEVIRSNEQVRRIAEAEEGYTEAAEHDTSIAGAETAVQAKAWLAEDREDIENESGANGLYVKKIMDRNNKRITDETVAAVDRMISDKAYHPGELDEMANKARMTFLKDVFNRILGSRN